MVDNQFDDELREIVAFPLSYVCDDMRFELPEVIMETKQLDAEIKKAIYDDKIYKRVIKRVLVTKSARRESFFARQALRTTRGKSRDEKRAKVSIEERVQVSSEELAQLSYDNQRELKDAERRIEKMDKKITKDEATKHLLKAKKKLEEKIEATKSNSHTSIQVFRYFETFFGAVLRQCDDDPQVVANEITESVSSTAVRKNVILPPAPELMTTYVTPIADTSSLPQTARKFARQAAVREATQAQKDMIVAKEPRPAVHPSLIEAIPCREPIVFGGGPLIDITKHVVVHPPPAELARRNSEMFKAVLSTRPGYELPDPVFSSSTSTSSSKRQWGSVKVCDVCMCVACECRSAKKAKK